MTSVAIHDKHLPFPNRLVSCSTEPGHNQCQLANTRYPWKIKMQTHSLSGASTLENTVGREKWGIVRSLRVSDGNVHRVPPGGDVEANAVQLLHTLGVGIDADTAGLDDGALVASVAGADLAAGNVHVVVLGDERGAVGAGPLVVAGVAGVGLGPVASELTKRRLLNLVGAEGADGLRVLLGDDRLGLAGAEHEAKRGLPGHVKHARETARGPDLVEAHHLVGLAGDVGVLLLVSVQVGDVVGDEHHVGVPGAAGTGSRVAGVHDLGGRHALRLDGALAFGAEGDVLSGAGGGGCNGRGGDTRGSGGSGGGGAGGCRRRLEGLELGTDILDELLSRWGGALFEGGAMEVGVGMDVARGVRRNAHDAPREE